MAQVIYEITMQTEGIDVFNIGSGRAMSVQQALDILVEAAGRKIDIVSVAARQRSNDRPYLCPAVDKITVALGRAAKSFDLATAKAIWAATPNMRRFYK
jgi:UDP-glucose 4-epimerase